MRIFLIFLSATLLFFSSCDSDIKEDQRRKEPSLCCAQSVLKDVSTAAKDTSKVHTRGWEGNIGPNDNFPSVDYPNNMIYLYTKTGATGGNVWNETPLAIPVIKSNGREYVNLCFKAEEDQHGYADDRSPIIISSDEGSIKGTEFFFSSHPTLQVSMDVSSSLKTPGNQTVYEPFGDNLFSSSRVYEFRYDPRGDIIFEMHQSRFEDVTTFHVDMNRLTSVVIPRIIISDNYPKYEDGKPIQNGETEFDINKFTSKLGKAEDWSVRFFIAGINNETGFPLEFEMNTMLEYGNVRDPKVLIGHVVDNSSKGIVALSKNECVLNDKMDHQIRDNFGNSFTYYGVGVHDNSFPFIYWTDNMTEMSLCCSFYYHGQDAKLRQVNKMTNTIRFPLNQWHLPYNQILISTFVIDIDDVVAALTGSEFPGPPAASYASRGIKVTADTSFGNIIELPATVLLN